MKAIPRYETARMTILALMSGGAKRPTGTRAAAGRDRGTETARITVPASVDRKDVRRSTAASSQVK
jgi:hypothetical protein